MIPVDTYIKYRRGLWRSNKSRIRDVSFKPLDTWREYLQTIQVSLPSVEASQVSDLDHEKSVDRQWRAKRKSHKAEEKQSSGAISGG